MSGSGSSFAPGFPFILGYSDNNFFDKAISNGWISKDTLLNTPANQYNKRDLSFRTLIEPIPGLRIDLNADRRYLESIAHIILQIITEIFPTAHETAVMLCRAISRLLSSHGEQPLKKFQRIMTISLPLLKLSRRILHYLGEESR